MQHECEICSKKPDRRHHVLFTLMKSMQLGESGRDSRYHFTFEIKDVPNKTTNFLRCEL